MPEPQTGQFHMMDDHAFIGGIMFMSDPEAVIIRIERKPEVWVAEVVIDKTGAITGRTFPIPAEGPDGVRRTSPENIGDLLHDVSERASDVLRAARDTTESFQRLQEDA